MANVIQLLEAHLIYGVLNSPSVKHQVVGSTNQINTTLTSNFKPIFSALLSLMSRSVRIVVEC